MERGRVVGKWPKAGVTFETTRGSFEISAEVLARADVTGDDFEIRRAFAIGIPPGARATRREKVRGGLRISWRIIRVVSAVEGDLEVADRDPVERYPVRRERFTDRAGDLRVTFDAPVRLAGGEVEKFSEGVGHAHSRLST